MLIRDMIACSFSNWKNDFKDLIAESCVIDMPSEFREYLGRNGVYMPLQECDIETNDEDSWENDRIHESGSANDDGVPEFHDLENEIESAIDLLGGFVFPKLNWSAPKDAVWITLGKSASVARYLELLLLFKSSDFIAHDIFTPFNFCTDYNPNEVVEFQPQIVLKKWTEYNPMCEFRCFVRDKRLIGVSQRKTDTFFDSIIIQQETIKSRSKRFVEGEVIPVFPLSDYTVDIHCDFTNPGHKECQIIDFNVYGYPTDPLLFSYSELDGFLVEDALQLRIVTDTGIKASEMAQYRVPLDAVQMLGAESPLNLEELITLRLKDIDN